MGNVVDGVVGDAVVGGVVGVSVVGGVGGVGGGAVVQPWVGLWWAGLWV